MKAKSCMMLMATMVAMLLMAMACSEKNNAEPEEPTKPENPVNPDDWHTVPISGGDISLDNFTISLPSGTFTSETKMAVTKVQAGEICGKNEVTNFYQITSPIATHKPMTVKVASEELGDGYCLVIHAPSYLQSGEETSYSNVYMETTYANGAYSATIPELTNSEGVEDNKNLNFAIGLVKVPTIGKTDTRASKNPPIAEGEVSGVKWVLYADPSASSSDDIWGKIDNPELHAAVAKYIEASLKTLLDMGFTLKNQSNRVIPFYYKRYYEQMGVGQIKWNTSKVKPDLYGGFEPSLVDASYSIIALGIDKLAKELESSGHSSLKTTIIHELFHYFQYELDSRAQINKGSGYYIDNRSILYEMASVWSEQFMNNGELNKDFLYEHFDPFKPLGIGMEKERFKGEEKPNAEQGYLLGPWLHYLVKEIKARNLKHENKHPVWELFELYRTNWVNGSHNAYYILQEWLDSYDKDLYNGAYWDDYYLQLWQGELVKGFHINQFLSSYFSDVAFKFKNEFKTIPYDSECYPYGCLFQKFKMEDFKGIDLSGKELVVKQNTTGLGTYLLWTNRQDNWTKYSIYKREQRSFPVFEGDSIVIRGKNLEVLRMADGTFNHAFFLITTNTLPTSLVSAYISGKPYTSRITVELRDTLEVKKQLKVTPQNLEVDAEGGSFTFKVDKGNFSEAGFFFEGERAEWPDWFYCDNYNKRDDTFKINVYRNLSNKGYTYNGLIVWAANRNFDLLDKEHEPYELAKVTIQQKAYVKRGNVSAILAQYHFSSENAPSSSLDWSTKFYSSDETVKITTERVGNGIRVTATKNESKHDWGDYQRSITFTIPEISDYDGYSEIRDLNIKYANTRNSTSYDIVEEIHEVEAESIPFSHDYRGELDFGWRDDYVPGKSNFTLKDWQEGDNHYPWTPTKDDNINIRISFE